MKCADIDDDAFMDAVAATPHWPGGCWRMRNEVHAVLTAALGFDVPEKLFLAKARKLGQKQRLEGCTDCSCRGDYHLPRECFEHGCCYGPEFDWKTHPQWDESWLARPDGPARPPVPRGA